MKKYIISIVSTALCLMSAYADNISVADVSISPGTPQSVSINLTNTEANLVSFQMDLTLPDGITVNKSGCSLSSRFPDDQELTIGRQPNGAIRLISTSFNLSPINGNSGEIITLSLTTSADSEGGTATISNIRFVTSNSERITLADATFSISVASASPNITFADPAVKAICVGATTNWDTNHDGELSKAEAAAVTDLGTVFKGKQSIKSFDELQYFTGLKSIGNEAFSGCTSLTSVTIPQGVTSIGNKVFSGCTSLTFVTIPQSVTSIGDYAFSGCSSLPSVTIPQGVTSIGNSTFENCSSLTSMTIPNSATSIGNYAFQGCTHLTSVTIPQSVTSIGSRVFSGCTSLTSITIPNSVTIIGGYAFYGCSSLTSITIPNSVTIIGRRVFSGCTSLTSITIPNSVTKISDEAFYGCSSLTSITIPGSVTSIGSYTFCDCNHLTDVYCLAEEVPSTNITAFLGSSYKSATLYVLKASLAAYKATAPWSSFGSIVAVDAVYYDINDETTSLSIASEESGSDVKFTHNFNGDWEALYLPIAIDYDAIKTDFDLAEIDGVVQNDDNNDGVADITVLSIMGFKGQTTTPNKPYLIRAKNTGEQTISFEGVTIYPTEEATFDCSSFSTKYEFTGSYNTLDASALANCYIIQDGELVKGASTLSPCRWYMTATARDGAQLNLPNKIRIMSVEDVITGIETLSDSPLKGEDIYNLADQRLGNSQCIIHNSKLPQGIYIVGGKKILK